MKVDGEEIVKVHSSHLGIRKNCHSYDINFGLWP